MESSSKPVPRAVEKTHEQITQLYKGNKDLSQGPADIQDLSRMLGKMFGKTDSENIQSTVDCMFKVAQDKMESEHDKKVLVGLRQMVRELEE